MKFNKKDWRVHKLAPNVLVNNTSQTLRLFISDSISNSPIKSARVKIASFVRGDRTNVNGTETIHLDWTELTLVNDFYEADISLASTLPLGGDNETELFVEITEEDDSIDFTDRLKITIRGA